MALRGGQLAAGLAAFGLAFGWASASPAAAATIPVTTTSDEFGEGAACGLREAVQAATFNVSFGGCAPGSADPNGDLVSLAAGTHLLTRDNADPATNDDNADGDLDLGLPVRIAGAGAGATAIELSGVHEGGDRVMHVLGGGGVASLADLSIGGGASAGEGGGVLVEPGVALVLRRTVVTRNAAASGGGIASRGSVTVSDSTLNGNFALSGPGAAIATHGTLVLTNSTISGNLAAGDGGGLYVGGGAASILTTTLTANRAGFGKRDGDGGGLAQAASSVAFGSSILAANFDDGADAGQSPDCAGAISSARGNLIGNLTGCAFAIATGDANGVPAGLGALAPNGGPTSTHAVLPGSAAIGRGAACPEFDQRGARRDDCDAGAYELARCGGTIVNVVGTVLADTLAGTPGPDGIIGGAGKDTLRGLAGADSLCGGSGRDLLVGGAGRDRLLGEGGKDRLVGGKGKDRCRGGKGRDRTKGCENAR